MHADRYELSADGECVRVQPRLIALLHRLALAQGATVSRETLLDEVWSRRMVNDEVLSRAIADLRQALGDDARAPSYLVTVPKLGYRLVAPVSFVLEAATTATLDSSTDSPPVAAADPTDAPARPARGLRTRWWPLLAGAVVAGLLLWWRWAAVTPTLAPLTSAQLAQAQPLSSEPGWELSPRISPSGRWIAYAQTDASHAHARIRVRTRDGQQWRELPAGAWSDLCPLFSADESTLWFQRYTDDDCQLMRVPILVDHPVAIAACAADVRSCADFSANGGSLLYTAPPLDAAHGAGIAQLRLADGHIEQLTTPPASSGADLDPIEIDNRIYFARGSSSDASLYVVEHGKERRLPVAASMVYGIEDLADGRLLLASDLLGFRALLALDPRSGDAELLGARGARYPHRNAAGDLVYESASYDANLWLYQGTEQGERLTASTRYDGYPRLSPDARLLTYQSNREGLEGLYLLDLSTRTERKLPLDSRERWAHPAWAPDGSALLVTRYAASATEIWRYLPVSDRAQRLDDLPAGAHDAQFDPDGRSIWYLVAAPGGLSLRRHTPEGDLPDLIFPGAVHHYLIDSQGLFLISGENAPLQRCAWPGPQPCQALAVRPAAGQARNWAVSHNSVYWVSSEPDLRLQLRRLSLSTGQSERLPWAPPSTLSRGLDVSADGRILIIARTDHVDVDLMWLPAATP